MPFRLPITGLAVLALVTLAYFSLVAKPFTPENPIARGLEAERNHDLISAERDLLAAAAADHQYGPRWTLAGFYFRHDRQDEFWKWTRDALNVGTRELGGLFDLCWFRSPDAAVVWARAIPDRKEIWNEYLSYLLAADHWEAASDAARKLAARSAVTDIPVLTAFCDIALHKQDPLPAAPVWNELCRRGLIDLKPLAPCHYLFNGEWLHKPSGRGFDWRLSPNKNIREAWTPGELHIAFSGMQAVPGELLSQSLALPPGESYELRSSYRARYLPADSGVRWRIEIDGALAAESEPFHENATAPATLPFTVPPAAHSVTLRLIDDRTSPGTLLLNTIDLVARASACAPQ